MTRENHGGGALLVGCRGLRQSFEERIDRLAAVQQREQAAVVITGVTSWSRRFDSAVTA